MIVTETPVPQNLTICDQTLRSINFSPEAFWFILFGLTVASAVAFVAMNYLPLAKKHYSAVDNYVKAKNNDKPEDTQLDCNDNSVCHDKHDTMVSIKY